MASTHFLSETNDQALHAARQEITQLHQEVLLHLEAALRKGIRIGSRLVELQSRLKHSRYYEKWIRINLSFSPRTARDYVTLFRNRELLEHESDEDSLSIRAALKYIADTAKAATPIQIEPGPLEIDVASEEVAEEDAVSLSNREVLLVEADVGFIAELVSLICRARQAGHKIEHQKLSVFDPESPNSHFQRILGKR